MSLTYAVVPNEDFTRYTFCTDNNIGYYIYFASYVFRDEEGQDIHVPSFNFDCIDPTVRPPKDEKVKNTIVRFVFEYLESNPDIPMLYICDNSDDREFARRRTFLRWFNEFESVHPNIFERYEFTQQTEFQNIYATFIIRADTPLKDYYINAFNVTVELVAEELVK